MFGFGVGIQRLGSFGVDTHAALLALAAPASGLRPTGFVYADPDTTKNGVYTWTGSTWVRDRGLPEQIATLTVTGGTANAIVATAQAGVELAQIVVCLLTPTAANTGAVTLNGKAVKDADGAALVANSIVAGKTYLIADRGTEFRILLNEVAHIADVIGLEEALEGKATQEQGGKADTALQPTNGVFFIETFSGAPSASIPASVARLFVGDRGAWFKVAASEPSHLLKFQNAGRWFEIDEPTINIKMAGAKGDNATNDTAAWLAARSTQRPIFWPAGTYLVDFLDWSSRSYIVPMRGENATIKKRVDDGNPLLKINSPAWADKGYVPFVNVDGIAFDADHKADYAVIHWNLVRSTFGGKCKFLNARVDGCLQLGGISNTYVLPDAVSCGRAGIAFDKYSTTNPSNPSETEVMPPNDNNVMVGHILDNVKYGIYFDAGRNLTIFLGDMEGNGDPTDEFTGNIVVGNGIPSGEPGVVIMGGWNERGKADTAKFSGAIRLGSGHNRLSHGYSVANQTYTDIYVSGGTYTVFDWVFTGVRTYIKEGPGVGYGNLILDCKLTGGSFDIDKAKTFRRNSVAELSPRPSFTPTLSADAGTSITPAYAAGRHRLVGVDADVTIHAGFNTVVGGGGDAIVTTPYIAKESVPVTVINDNTGALLCGTTVANTNQIRVRGLNGTSIVAPGVGFSIRTGVYETVP